MSEEDEDDCGESLRGRTRQGECSCCGFEPVEVKKYHPKGMWLCRVCACSPAGTAHEYISPGVATLRMIAVCTNMILAKIGSQGGGS